MRVAISNRGEVALRIINACKELGFTSILLHSTADKKTAAYEMADEVVELEGNTSLETYLDIQKVVDKAKSAKAQFLHPGFGFLSENAQFVKAVEDAGIAFVGPTAKSIELVGNKAQAKNLAMKVGVPVTNAYTGDSMDPKLLFEEAKKIGFPCIIKARTGGGGKGMKVVLSEGEFDEQLASAQREAVAAFGSDKVLIEKYISKPKHVEVQILCDSHGNRVHLFERDCTVQRRHQKIIEETPSEGLPPHIRSKVTQDALKIAEASHYINAGTVEFLLDDSGNHYFMELNTRLQVEHTVTEQVCGIDLVHEQFAVAQGKTLSFSQEDLEQRGHALEVRVYSEDPEREFLPSTGTIHELILPNGPGRRFDFTYKKGNPITAFYDPMIGKIITWAPTRQKNIARMLATLNETVIFGVKTNIEFLKSVLSNEKFLLGQITTKFLEEEYSGGFQPEPLTEEQKKLAFENQNEKTTESKSLKSPWNQITLGD